MREVFYLLITYIMISRRIVADLNFLGNILRISRQYLGKD